MDVVSSKSTVDSINSKKTPQSAPSQFSYSNELITVCWLIEMLNTHAVSEVVQLVFLLISQGSGVVGHWIS